MDALIIFSKIPIPGTVKTRLIGTITDEDAAEFARSMLLDLFDKFRNSEFKVFYSYSPVGKLSQIIESIPGSFEVFPQRGDSMGAKMYASMEYVFKGGYEKVVLVGSDIPQLSENMVLEAFKSLETSDVTISPTYDGGYYLIGAGDIKTMKKVLLSDIRWSTKSVYDTTLEVIYAENFSVQEGIVLSDIDIADDINNIHDYTDIGHRTLENIKKIKNK